MAEDMRLADVTEVEGLGMILIRADLARAGEAIAGAAGLRVPAQTRFAAQGERWLGWMSPDELLLVLPAAEVPAVAAALRDVLAAGHALIEDVSAMRCVFDLTGPAAWQVLAKLCPVDFETMPRDAVRRTRAAQIACALWRQDDGWRIVAFRSVRDYAERLLLTAAAGAGLAPR